MTSPAEGKKQINIEVPVADLGCIEALANIDGYSSIRKFIAGLVLREMADRSEELSEYLERQIESLDKYNDSITNPV